MTEVNNPASKSPKTEQLLCCFQGFPSSQLSPVLPIVKTVLIHILHLYSVNFKALTHKAVTSDALLRTGSKLYRHRARSPQIPHAGQTMIQLQVYQSTEVPPKATPELLVFNLPCSNAQHMGTMAHLCPSYSRRLRLGSWSSK